jgi:hypothetical protein
MHYDWFNGIEILQGRGQHGERVGYCYPSGLEKTLFKWEIFVPLVTKRLNYKWLVKRKLYECKKLSPFSLRYYMSPVFGEA